MEYRRFGNSNLETSVIGFGCWPMGRGMYGSFVENEAIKAIHKALDLGVTLFDTAQVYGWGASEELLGRALIGKRHDSIIVTKGGKRWVDNPSLGTYDTEDSRGTPETLDSSKQLLNKMLEDSLRRLQTDYIDLFLIHAPDTSRPLSEPMEVFTKWKEEGKIRYGGVSNFSVAQMEESLKTFPIICNQVGYSLFNRQPEEEMFPSCRKHGVGIMAYASLASGLLTGAITADTKFEEDDWRRNLYRRWGYTLFEGEHFIRNLETVEKLKKIAVSRGKTIAQLAVAWVLSNPGVTVALTGVRRPSEIEDNAVAGGWKLTDEVKAEIEAVFEEYTREASEGL
ncbi:Aldo-keto reductase YhdN [subsurface metagenome]